MKEDNNIESSIGMTILAMAVFGIAKANILRA
jgi:hypothetical protein